MRYLDLVYRTDQERATGKPAEDKPSSAVAVAEAPMLQASPSLDEGCGPYTHIAPDVCPLCGPDSSKMVEAKLSPTSGNEVVYFCPAHAITQLIPTRG